MANAAPAAAIATPHPQATIAARDILRDGGNAYDAAVAAVLTLCVVQSHQVGLGGYGGSLVGYLANENRVVAIDFDSRAPLGFTPDAFADPADRTTGYRSITAPAVLAGLELALTTCGTMRWERVTAHAIRCAKQGFVVDPTLGQCLKEWSTKADADSRAAYFADGTIPAAGERWVQPQLARVLRQIARDGPAVFYRGEIAQAIVRQIRSHGGILSERDFSDCHAELAEPITCNYRGHAVYTPPPPSGGLTTLQILQTLQQFDVAQMKPWSANYFHVLAQAARLCWQDRERFLGDPKRIDVRIADLLSEKRAVERSQRIQRGDVHLTAQVSTDRPCTANVSIIDARRNVVSLTATQGVYFGSGVVIPGTGVIMNHGMSRFNFPPTPDHPNAPQPGKRVQHNMAPTIVLKDGQPRYAIGLPGGTKIVTVTAQLAIDLIEFGTSARQAVAAARIHAQDDEPITVSSAVSDETMDQLRAMGHKVARGQVDGPPLEVGGAANVLALDPSSGKLEAASQAFEDAALVI
jgi:gamma-glutamyltranspeptidase/glutathione hydrolase